MKITANMEAPIIVAKLVEFLYFRSGLFDYLLLHVSNKMSVKSVGFLSVRIFGCWVWLTSCRIYYSSQCQTYLSSSMVFIKSFFNLLKLDHSMFLQVLLFGNIG